MQTITCSFDSFGNSKVDAEGFVGSSCEDATKAFINALAAKQTDDEKKPEYSQGTGQANTLGQSW